MDLMQWKPFNEDFTDLSSAMRKVSASPSMDLYEEEGQLIAKVTVPGISPDDMEIIIDNDNVLTISGERQEEEETDTKDYYSKEIRRGSFLRSIKLPKLIDTNASRASYADGLLTITMPTIEGEEKGGVKVPIN